MRPARTETHRENRTKRRTGWLVSAWPEDQDPDKSPDFATKQSNKQIILMRKNGLVESSSVISDMCAIYLAWNDVLIEVVGC
jgi:hypothetical protein